MFDFKFNFNFVPVSTDFIENYMTNAHGAYVKVYLYILNMAIKGESSEPRQIAKKLNLLESDVMNAIEYWQEKKLLSFNGSVVVVGASIGESAPAASNAPSYNEPTPEPVTAAPSKPESTPDPMRTKRTAATINADPLADEKLSEITAMAQEFLGKTLNDNDISTLYWFYEELGFPAELIMMLLEYCVSKDKRDMRYIEKVAIAWHKRGITDIASAERYMAEEADSQKYFYDLKKLFGITDRNFSKKEEEYLTQWHEKYGMNVEMIALAYEYCIMAISKMSFQYMDSIIKNWNKAGIKTIEDAEKDHENFKNRTKKFSDKDTSVFKPDGTDYADIERRMNEKY